MNKYFKNALQTLENWIEIKSVKTAPENRAPYGANILKMLERALDDSKKLGFEKSDAKFGAVDTTYQHYYRVDCDTVNLHTPKILFDMEPPEWAKIRIDHK